MAVAVRRAREQDAELISSVNAEVQALHAAALPHWFKPAGEDTFPPAMVRGLLLEDDTFVFVAERDGVGVGYAYAQIVRQPETPWRYGQDIFYVHQIGVRSTARRQGVGEALLAAAEAEAAARGIGVAALDHWSFNDTARAFFRGCGYAPYNERLWKSVEAR